MLRRTFLASAIAAAFVTTACDSPTGNAGAARFTLLLTDAPHEYLESAVVDIGRIELRGDGAPIILTTDAGEYDLLLLQDGVTAALASTDIEPGRYSELRMFVTGARVTLKDGHTFADGSTTMDVAVPSGAASGIKVKLAGTDGKRGGGIDIRPGETILVVDFDVSQNFVMQGTPDTPAEIKGFLFTPLLRATVRDVAGSISGSVTAPDDVVTEGLTVTATLVDAEPDDVAATTLVKEDGTFTLHFLAPGTYNVTVSDPPAGHSASTVEKAVGPAEHVTGVEIEIAAS
jgi:hypothetical protein